MKTDKTLLILTLICSLVAYNCETENILQNNDEKNNIINKGSNTSSDRNSIFPLTDCSMNLTNLQYLINDAAVTGATCIINNGTYCIDGTLTIPSNVTVDFNNSTIIRETGTTIVYDLISNLDFVNGNNNITIKNLIIDGVFAADSLNKHNDAHRFSGLRLKNCNDINLENITVYRTVNGEHIQNTPAAGIFVESGNNISCNAINGISNLGTAIIFEECNSVIVDDSTTRDNVGSGLSAVYTDDSEFKNLLSHDNGDFNTSNDNDYSNISINGENNIVDNIETFGADASGLNLGHTGNPSNNNIASNVISYGNSLDGITVTDSDDVHLNNIEVYNNNRNNVLIGANSSNSTINNAEIYCNNNNPVNGILINSGVGHYISDALIYDNKCGIYFQNLISDHNKTNVGGNIEIYDNGEISNDWNSGILIQNSTGIDINTPIRPKIYYNNPNGQEIQNFGIFVKNNSHNIKIIYRAVDFLPYDSTNAVKVSSDSSATILVSI